MQDIKLTENYDLKIQNGDFVMGNASNQHIKLLLLSFQGEWKSSPLIGCNIKNAINGVIDRMLDRHIRIQLEADGFDLEEMNLSPKGIQIKGQYNGEK